MPEDKVECEWRPELHHGRQCPIHSGASVKDFDNTTLMASEHAKKLKSHMKVLSNNITSEQVEEWCNLIFENMSDEYADIVSKFLDNVSIFIEDPEKEGDVSSFNINYDTGKIWISLRPYSIRNELEKRDAARFMGETGLHEYGHFVNCMISQRLSNAVTKFMTQNARFCATSVYISKATGKSLQETLRSEFRKIREEDIMEMYEERLDYLQEALAEHGISRKEFIQWNNKIADTPLESRDDIKKMFKETYGFDYTFKIVYDAYSKIQLDYTAISDVVSSRYYKSEVIGTKAKGVGFRKEFKSQKEGFGHSETYYRDKFPDSGLGDEFFANIFSAYCGGQRRMIETTRAYFPETMKVYDEIIQKIKEL